MPAGCFFIDASIQTCPSFLPANPIRQRYLYTLYFIENFGIYWKILAGINQNFGKVRGPSGWGRGWWRDRFFFWRWAVVRCRSFQAAVGTVEGLFINRQSPEGLFVILQPPEGLFHRFHSRRRGLFFNRVGDSGGTDFYSAGGRRWERWRGRFFLFSSVKHR